MLYEGYTKYKLACQRIEKYANNTFSDTFFNQFAIGTTLVLKITFHIGTFDFLGSPSKTTSLSKANGGI